MPKENIDGFDFTKDYTPQEIYEMLKDEILTACGESVGMQVSDEEVELGSKSICMVHEMNNKLYSAFSIQVLVKVSDSIWKDYALRITPFNCYWQRFIENCEINNNNRNIDLTKALRRVMKEKYGKVYVDAKNSFINEVKDFKVELETNVYNHRVSVINRQYAEDLKI